MRYDKHTGHGCPEEAIERMLAAIDSAAQAQGLPPIEGVRILDQSGALRMEIGEPFPLRPVKPPKDMTRKELRRRLREVQAEATEIMGELTEALQKTDKRREKAQAQADRAQAQADEAQRLVEDLMAKLAATQTQLQSLQKEKAEVAQQVDAMLDGDDDNQTCPQGPDSCKSPSSHRQLTETWAVPKCNLNRWEQVNFQGDTPARFCVSAYCQRCNAYRREAGVQEVTPNQWLSELRGNLDSLGAAVQAPTVLPELAAAPPGADA